MKIEKHWDRFSFMFMKCQWFRLIPNMTRIRKSEAFSYYQSFSISFLCFWVMITFIGKRIKEPWEIEGTYEYNQRNQGIA